MARVVQEACVNCKYADCVEVCPVDCFFELDDMLVINPEECIDCEACDFECPVSAIVPEEDALEKWIMKNKNVEWLEHLRRSTKNSVSPGSNQDPNISSQ